MKLFIFSQNVWALFSFVWMSKPLELISYCRNAFHFQAICKDSRIVPGAATTEIELDQYAIAKFAESFEMVPKTLAKNAGLNAMEIISSLYAEHASGNTKVGLDLEEGRCKDVSTLNIWDLHITKFFALKYAADAACTVLRVDQIIMGKLAGGPSKRDQPAGMDED
ncbi:hypothetical protein CerSpe_069370 [Prunus speciosa]